MVGLVETPGAPSVGLGFSVSHQKVELDIDLALRGLKGITELTINPEFKDLRVVRLHCRQCDIKRITVNGKSVSNFTYNDPYARAKLHWHAGVHQYHMLRERLEPQMKIPPETELLVTIPKSVKIDEVDPFSVEAQNLLLSKSVGLPKRDSDASVTDLAQVSKTAVEHTARFTPLTISVEYSIKDIRDGMHFVGWDHGDMRYPHAYFRNSVSYESACCLFPCVNEISSRCTWEISIKCAKTIGDTLKHNAEISAQPLISGSNRINGYPQKANISEDCSRFSEEDKALDLSVVCSGDLTDEIIDPLDNTKKTSSFLCTTSVAPQQIGFAIGPFEHVDLAEFRESDEDDKLGQNAIPVHGFCLPGRVDELKNTCLPLAKAVDFFTLTYGSYPFSTYKICFIEDLVADTVDFMSLSICSSRLLFPGDVIEPLDSVTREIVHALASQWIGVNIVPKEPTDTWAVVGIAYYITDTFIKKLCGNNEYRYRQKMASDRVCELDVARPSIFDMGGIIWLDHSELEFLALKAPLVLFTLDRRIIKASGSSGLSRIISRIFLNAKVGDLENSAISTSFFMKTCEKLGHVKLETFFAQWVQGAGCPRFRVTQRFNKKKLVVEMLIQQAQSDQSLERDLDKRSFMREVKEDINGIYAGPVQPAFTGPMTIRIHEADGTPYEHIVEIKEALTKFDIPYNTKYKRLKRSRRQKERQAIAIGGEFGTDVQEDVLLYSLGDVLQTEEEMLDWRLDEWSKQDEDNMSQESYEWIRMDVDFEWICKMSITMPGYMYTSQLQQDRDVVAQLESVQFMAAQRPHPLVSTILIRTLMDRRYFYGIRLAAAAALSKQAKDEIAWAGLYHLEKAFEQLFCYTNSLMTRPNDFSDRVSYYIQCAIPRAIAKVRDVSGRASFRVRNFLLDKLRFNDNSNNEFSDSHYIATLMISLAQCMAVSPIHQDEDFDMGSDDEDSIRFHKSCLDEIDRYRRLDEWIPSYHNVLSSTALDCTRLLARAGIIKFNPYDFLQYTQDETLDDLRLNAFTNLMELGAFRNDAILRWFLFVLSTESSPYVRENLLQLFGRTLGGIAIGDVSHPEFPAQTQNDGLVIEQETSTEARQANIARKQTVAGALIALRNEIGSNNVYKIALWEAMNSPVLTLREITELLDICAVLYDPETSMEVRLKYPRYWQCRKAGKGKLAFTLSSKIRTSPLPPLPLHVMPAAQHPPAASALPRSSGPTSRAPTKITFKSKQPPLASQSSANSSKTATSPGAARSPLQSPPEPEVRPKLTLKLSMKGAGGARSPGQPGSGR